MPLPELRMVLVIALVGSICIGPVAHAQPPEASQTDSLFTIYANELAAKLPCEEAKKKVRDSAFHLVSDQQRARWAENHGVQKGTAYINGKASNATLVVHEGDKIPLDSASVAFVNKEWIRKENCR